MVAVGRTYLFPPLSFGGALAVRPLLRFHIPLIGRVEDWRAGLGRCSCSLLSRPFVCECHSISTMPRFQSPPRRTQRADFPLYALLFASPQGLWDLSCRSDFQHVPPHAIAVSVRLRPFMLPSPSGWRLGPREYSLSRPQRVHFCYGPVTRKSPQGRPCR